MTEETKKCLELVRKMLESGCYKTSEIIKNIDYLISENKNEKQSKKIPKTKQ